MAGGIVSYCFFCGSAGPAGSSCPSCLVTIPRPSPEVARTFACPRCSNAQLLAIGIAPQATIHACPTCNGMFVGARAWCTLVARPELAQQIVSRMQTRGAPPQALVQLLRCPACTREMERGRFGASSNIVVDVCIEHGLWLDAGEVVAVSNHAAFRGRVGVDAARRALAAAEARSVDPAHAASDAAALDRSLRSATRIKTVKWTGLLVFVVLAVVRLAFFFTRGGAVAPSEIGAAGASAATAAGALRGP